EIGGKDENAALQAWDGLCHAFLTHGSATPTHLGALLENDPDNILGLSCKGFFMILLGRAELLEEADAALRKIDQVAARRGSFARRETDYVNALRLARRGQWARAADLLESVNEYAVHDAMAFKIVQGLRFMLGDRFGMRASSLRAVERFGSAHVASGYIYGCHAFALEETGDFRAAERFGKQAVMMAPDDAWGLHAVSHVYDMTAQAEKGTEWLEARTHQWAHCNNFAYHFWWHLALHYLEVGDVTKVLALYDNDIRRDHTDDYRDISNGTALLARLEGLGVNVGNRWDELIELSERRTEDNCVVFADLHYLQALGRGGKHEAVDKLIATIRKNAETGVRDMDHVNRFAGVFAAEGLKAFYQGDYGTAFDQLAMARPAMQQVGGSHAQRDVFERTTIEAGLLAGRYLEAKALIEDRTWRRGAEDNYARERMANALTKAEAAAIDAAHTDVTTSHPPLTLVSA
ncbi:MAG: tetratricopeptide repeat protein, partial [Pseudomonadota bacterium]